MVGGFAAMVSKFCRYCNANGSVGPPALLYTVKHVSHGCLFNVMKDCEGWLGLLQGEYGSSGGCYLRETAFTESEPLMGPRRYCQVPFLRFALF